MMAAMNPSRPPMSPRRRFLAAAAACWPALPAASALAALAGAVAAQPREALLPGWRDRAAAGRGRAEPGTQDLAWTDSARGRTLPLRLRWPPGEAAAPLVLFSHGLGGSVDAGTIWARAWAAAGIATLHLQHPGSDGEVLQREGAAALRGALDFEQLKARALDVAFVLDELARRRAAGDAALQRLRLQACGLAGHSFGAHTTLAVAGQQYGALGAALADDRPRAFAAFSPAPPERGDAARALGAVRRPVLCLSGSLDAGLAAPGGQGAGRAGTAAPGSGAFRRAVFEALPGGDKAELWLDGADHMTFSGQPVEGLRALRSRPEPARAQAPRHEALIAEVSTRWWQAQLLDDAAARAALARPPAALVAGDDWRRG